MHIAAGHMNLHAPQSNVSASVLAARRAEETRKKLAASASDIDVSLSEGAWMIAAWSGNSGNQQSGRQPDPGPDENSNQDPGHLSSQELSPSAKTPSVAYAPAYDAPTLSPSTAPGPAQAVSQNAAQLNRPVAVAATPPLSATPFSNDELPRSPAMRQVSFWA